MNRKDYLQLLKSQYSSKVAWREFKQTCRRVSVTMPLATQTLTAIKVVFYILSWVQGSAWIEAVFANTAGLSLLKA